jgi:hypothetical protein
MTNEVAVLKSIALRNGQKWGNIKRTIRDLTTIEDYESDRAAGQSTAEVLSNFLNKKENTNNKLVTIVEKLDARLAALEGK